MGDILVVHDTAQDLAVLEHTTWDFLDFGVSLDINLNFAVLVLLVDGSYGFDSKIDNEVTPLAGEFGTNSALDDLGQIFVSLKVDCDL